jgi:hypothetical protein
VHERARQRERERERARARRLTTFDDDGTMRGKGARKVVLITDGGNVNDTLALLLTALHALQGDLELKGIITGGGSPQTHAQTRTPDCAGLCWMHGTHRPRAGRGRVGLDAAGDKPTKRAATARDWLRQMGIADSQVVVEYGNAASDLLISLARLHKVGALVVSCGLGFSRSAELEPRRTPPLRFTPTCTGGHARPERLTSHSTASCQPLTRHHRERGQCSRRR